MANQIEYVELEWLGSDSSSFIDTGISGDTDNLTIECVFSYDKYIQYTAVYGNYIQDASNGYRTILGYRSGYAYINSNTKCDTGGNTEVVCPLNQKHTFIANNKEIVFNNKKYIPSVAKGNSNNSNIALFNRSVINPFPTVRDIGLKIYKFKIYDSEVLVRDFIPVLRKSDSKPGMYDLVSGQFFVNQGTGEFSYG